MSAVSIPFPPEPSPEPVFRLSVEQYHTMIDTGVLTDDDPVELLEGILVFKIPKKPFHRYVLRTLAKSIERLLPAGWFVQLQEPITLSTSEPEPDASVIRGEDKDYIKRHPTAEDTPIVVEVADTTLRRDRGIKQRMYARAGIAVYWIVNLEDRCIEVYTRPDSGAPEPAYRSKEVFDEASDAPLELAGTVVGRIRVAELLP